MQTIGQTLMTVLLAHVLSNFLFQTGSVAEKTQGLWAYVKRGILDLVILGSCIIVFSSFGLRSYRLWILLVGYVCVCVLIEFGKQRLVLKRNLKDSTGLFLLGQLVHGLAIIALATLVARAGWGLWISDVIWAKAKAEKILAGAVVYATVVFAAGHLIRYLTRSLSLQATPRAGETKEELRNAGMYIGWLERFLVLTAVVMQSPTMVGLILTGKSIARFPEIKEGEGRFAEYFLIGTFLSVTSAVIGGLILLKVWYGTISLK